MGALRKHAVRLGDIKSVDDPVVLGRAEMEKAWLSLTDGQREMLQRTRFVSLGIRLIGSSIPSRLLFAVLCT